MDTKQLEIGESDWKDLIKIILRNEDLDGDIKVVLKGTTEKGDGYVGDIFFIEVTGRTSKNEIKLYDLVLKCGKRDANLRQNMPIDKAFEREISVYRNVAPVFKKFLNEKKQPKFEGLARCYSTAVIEGIEYIALQNLKSKGYELYERKKPMDRNHLRLTLKTYGRWHGISFALKDQRKEEFDKILDRQSIWELFCQSDKHNFWNNVENTVIECLTRNQEYQLLKRFKEKYSPLYENWISLLKENDPEAVVIHGDCWNNNYMFYYEPDDKLKINPTKVVMLDFQASQFSSPVFDLSYHLFMVASDKDLDDLKGLLDIYYESLTETIRKLGSDPDQVFPYESLIKHWKKYHSVGLLLAMVVLPVTLTDKEDAINVEDINESTLQDILHKMTSKIRDKLDKRMIEIVNHVVTYEL